MDRLDGFWAVCACCCLVALVDDRRPDDPRRSPSSAPPARSGARPRGRSLAHPRRFRVEAVVGGRDAAALAGVARRLGARFAALADERGAETLKAALVRSGIAAGAGRGRRPRGGERDCDIVVAAISGTAGLQADACGAQGRPAHRARQQGEPRLRRRGLHGRGAAASAPRSARSIPSTTPSSRPWRPAATEDVDDGDPDRDRRAVPDLGAGADRRGDARRGGRPSGLVDGRRRSTSIPRP